PPIMTSCTSFRWFTFAVVLLLSTLGCNPASQNLVERRGGRVYQRMCAVCHGVTGGGYKADQAPALTRPEFLTSATDEFLRHAIANGRTGTTMSAWAMERGGPLSRADVNAVVAFLRSWGRGKRASLDEQPPRGDATRGNEIYVRECARCHGERGRGGPYVNIGNPQLLTTASDGFLRHAIKGGRPGTVMPSFAVRLGASGVDDVIAALRSWQPTTEPTHVEPTRPPPIPLGPVPIYPKGPEPVGFKANPEATGADVIKAQLDRHARIGILDARAPSDYVNEHIAGAVSVPFYDVDTYASKLPKDAWLVCYCSCPHAESGQLARALASKGFRKVTILDEGLGYWHRKKYETRKGQEP
ncbi:MAG TPA: c-type cytochrome, partial [Polyangiaceae bacterium]|nr:c-type cytochrome [Polyangiaceae bacterium]